MPKQKVYKVTVSWQGGTKVFIWDAAELAYHRIFFHVISVKEI